MGAPPGRASPVVEMDGQSGGQMGSWADGQSRDYQNFLDG